jgi:hypothetical protein
MTNAPPFAHASIDFALVVAIQTWRPRSSSDGLE